MRFITVLLALTPIFLFANEEAHEGTDIVARVINFTIFASILYYLIADKAKAYFSGRTKEIADKLSSVQERVEKTKELKQSAAKKLEDSQSQAKEILDIAKKEAKLQIEKLEENFKSDVKNLEKSYEEKKEVLEKKMNESVVSSVIDELFGANGVQLSDEELVNIINKKVA